MSKQQKIRVEFRSSFHGKVVLTIEGEEAIDCGQTDIYKLFYERASKRIRDQFIDSCTIFMLGRKQVEAIKKYFEPHEQTI